MNDTQPHEQVSPLSPPPPSAVPSPSPDGRVHGSSTDGPPPPPATGSGDGFFDQIRSAGVRRSRDRWVAGVCGGIAERLRVDPLLIRAGMIALLLLGVGFLAYLIAWALIPDQDDSILAEKAIRQGDGWGIFLLVVIGLGIVGIGPVFSDAGGLWSLMVTVAVIAGAWWVVTRARSTHGSAPAPTAAPGVGTPHGAGPGSATAPGRAEPVWAPANATPQGYEPPPASPHAAASASTAYARPKPRGGFAGFLLALGAAVLGYGLGQLVGPLGGASADLVAMLFATAAAGLTTIVLGLLGRRSALTGLLSIVLAVSLVGTWGITGAPAGGGQRVWEPTAQTLTSSYTWNAGQATLDLRGVTEPPDQREISADVSLGELVIYVPDGVTTRIVSGAELGSVTVDGPAPTYGVQNESGASVASEHVFGEGEVDLTVNASVRLGSIRIIGPSEQG